MLENNIGGVKDKTNFEYEMEGKRINRSEYRFFSYNNSEEKLDTANKEIIKEIVIIGAGPVGLLTGIITLQKGRSVAIVEIRENYTRNEIFMLQQNNKFDSINYLKNIGVFEEALKHGCWVSPPNIFAADCQKNMRDDINKRLAIRIKDLQFILEKKFIESGGTIIRPCAKNKLKYNIIRRGRFGKSITFITKNNSVITKKSISVFNNLTLKWSEMLIGADGASSNTRRNHFGGRLVDDPTLKLTYHYFDYHQNRMIHNEFDDNQDNFDKYSNVYGMVIHLNLPDYVYKQIKEFDIEREPQNRFRIFIPNRDSVNNKAYAGIQISRNDYGTIAFEIEQAKYNPNDQLLKKIVSNSTISSEDNSSNVSLILNFDDMELNDDALRIKFLTTIVTKIRQCLVHYGMNQYINPIQVLRMIHQVKIFPITIFSLQNDWNDKDDIKLLGDSTIGVHYFSGTGVNIGMKDGWEFINNLNNGLSGIELNRYKTNREIEKNEDIQASINIVNNFLVL
jgi:2-polyprenyl-6-methoxyphenol hydroxylase-like FAD-dependent oxidoreductase